MFFSPIRLCLRGAYFFLRGSEGGTSARLGVLSSETVARGVMLECCAEEWSSLNAGFAFTIFVWVLPFKLLMRVLPFKLLSWPVKKKLLLKLARQEEIATQVDFAIFRTFAKRVIRFCLIQTFAKRVIRFSYDFLMIFIWFSYDFLMISYDFPMIFLWFSYDFQG